MQATRPSEVRALLTELQVTPSKALGQNFLIDANVLSIMLDIIGAGDGDEILEIGPGLGVLTEPLTKAARRVVCVEKDRRLYAWLRERFKKQPNIELICADMLSVDHEALVKSGLTTVVSNLPYSVGSAILVNFLKAEHSPDRMILTMQLEVAHRILAVLGKPEFGLLSLWSGLTYDIAIPKIISPKCFFPAPAVKSAVIKMIKKDPPQASMAEKKIFFEITKFAFSQRRKQLKTSFRNMPHDMSFSGADALKSLRELKIDVTARPENLSLDNWLNISRFLLSK